MQVSSIFDLEIFSDSELRTFYKRAFDLIKVPKNEMAEFRFDLDRYALGFDETQTTKRLAVALLFGQS